MMSSCIKKLRRSRAVHEWFFGLGLLQNLEFSWCMALSHCLIADVLISGSRDWARLAVSHPRTGASQAYLGRKRGACNSPPNEFR